jgi:hypothetical protein
MKSSDFYKVLTDSSAFKRFENYIEKLKYDEEFISEIQFLRSNLIHIKTKEPLPEMGLDPRDYDTKIFYEYNWKCENISDTLVDYSPGLLEEVESFKEKYKLEHFHESFEHLLYFHGVNFRYKSIPFYDILDLREIIDINYYICDFSPYPKDLKDEVFGKINRLSRDTPIAILLHPGMSQRDVIDLIKKTYKSNSDSGIDDEFKKIYKSRRRNQKVIQIANYIYANKEKTAKTLMREIAEKFKVVHDYSYINQIRSLEIRKNGK